MTERADSITAVRLTGSDPAELLRFCDAKMRCHHWYQYWTIWTVKGFRIAHMGHVNAPMVLGTLGVIEAGLEALGIPHGAGGIQAATDALTAAALKD